MSAPEATRSAQARRAISMIDLTDLSDRCTLQAIDELCRRAVGPHGRTAAVCVWPAFVHQAATLLSGTGVAVATVVNFPTGGGDIDKTVAETLGAIADGADEIDLVLPYRTFLAGRPESAAAMIDAVGDMVVPPSKLKVILETGSFPDQDAVRSASWLAIEHGADFIKTSTGKTGVSATPAAVESMLEVIKAAGRPVGLKPSGGIRTLDDAALYLGLADRIMGSEWATPATFRFGASGLLDALEAVISGHESTGHPTVATTTY